VKTRVLRQLESDLEGEGFKRNTERWDRAMRTRKVALCKQAQAVASCNDCKAFDHCELVKQHLRDMRTPIKKVTV